MNRPTSQGLVIGLSKFVWVLFLSVIALLGLGHHALAKSPRQTSAPTHVAHNDGEAPPPDSPVQLPAFARDTLTSVTRNTDAGTPTGAFNYTYPFTLPPGRSGMTPSLSLSYSSQNDSDYDVFGYGWNISIPYIQRENYQGTDQLYTSVAPRFFSSLSGEMATTSVSNAYVARNDDGSDLQYSYNGSGWTVLDKAGNTYYFGTSAAARQDNPTDTGQVYKWMLEQERDANGNSVSYFYTKDLGQIYPASTTYSGSGGSPGPFSVSFALGLRATTTATSSAAGFPVQSRYEVDHITTRVNGSPARDYDLQYTAGDDGSRLMLANVSESGIDDLGATTTLPATTFSYSTSTPVWDNAGSYIPQTYGYFAADSQDDGYTLIDVNGDGLVDILYSIDADGFFRKHAYLNNGSGWTEDSGWTASIPCTFVENSDDSFIGGTVTDVDGDGLPDFVCNHSVYLNNGSGWTFSSAWYNPAVISDLSTNLGDGGTRLVDANGDGLMDIVQSFYYNANYEDRHFIENVYLNNGAGWTLAPTWSIPAVFSEYVDGSQGVQVEDVNGDGIADVITGSRVDGYLGEAPDTVYLGTGSGWATSTWSMPTDPDGRDRRLMDFNNDGLPDIVVAAHDISSGWIQNDVYLNTGSGWALDPALHMPFPIEEGGNDSGLRMADADGDGSPDFLISGAASSPESFVYDDVLLGHTSGVDLVSRVQEEKGATVTPAYRSVQSYKDSQGNELNAQLISNPTVLSKLDRYDGVAATTTSSYTYQDGALYYGGPFDRRQAGFGEVTQTDTAGNSIKTYYHQGNGTNAALGEYQDNESKIGRPYRVEVSDNHSNPYSVQVNTWDSYARGGLASFVKLIQSTLLAYDGDTDHMDKAETYAYNDANSDITERTEWGNVLAANDGSFADVGSDTFVTDTTYAASSTNPLSLPDQITTTDQSGNIVRKTTNYYDTLGFGSATKGNLTKQLQQISSTTNAETDTVYNGYGLPTQVTDPRNNSTTYAYDAYNLYPATTTNALGYTTTALYNYQTGKSKQTTNENGVTFTTVFDGLGRVLEQDEPDPLNASSSAPKVKYVYTDTGMPRSVQETDYLGSSTSAVSYTYLDGLGRAIQKLAEAEGSNAYNSVVDSYDSRGLLHSESLPYAVNSSSFSALSSPPSSSLLTTYTYDPLARVTSAKTNVGTTANSYDQWKTTTTDPDGHLKDYVDDAYGNLVEVDEHNNDGVYHTYYAYDGNNNLTQLTDANGNVRSFAYDELSRRTSAEDLHAPGANTFGAWTYTYDPAGNVTKQKDPKNKTVNYTFDALNRVLTEKLAGLGTGTTTGGSNVDIAYQYDSCAYGKMQLCSASTTDAFTGYTYTPLGMRASEIETIHGTLFTTSYAYDRLGNKTGITYPDGSQVQYAYNGAGQLESVAQEPSGGSTFTPIVQDFDYAPNGKVSYELFGNGVATTNTYDPKQLYRLVHIQTIAPTAPQHAEVASSTPQVESGESEASTATSTVSEPLSFAPYFNLSDEAFVPTDPVVETTTPEMPVTPGVPDELVSSAPSTTTAATSTPVIDTPATSTPVIDAPATSTPITSTSTVSDAAPIPDLEVSTSTASATVSEVDRLLALPADAPELALKASSDKLLGMKDLGNGLVKYAYNSGVSVEDVPASSAVEKQAARSGVTLGAEMVGKRTSHARIFSTDQPGEYIAEVGSGEPQYYRDQNGKWWIADYGVTTRAAYDAQTAPKQVSLVSKILSFFFGTSSLAEAQTITFYPDDTSGSDAVDGQAQTYGVMDWEQARTSQDGSAGNSLGQTVSVFDHLNHYFDYPAYDISRGFFSFDTSFLGSQGVIQSANLSLYVTEIDVAASGTPQVFAVAADPASTDQVTRYDFGSVGLTAFGSTPEVYTAGSRVSISLNAAGVESINQTGVSSFAIRTYNDLIDVVPSDADESNVIIAAAAQDGISEDPELIVTYTAQLERPDGLLTQDLTNPQNLGNHTPYFSAVFNTINPGSWVSNYELQVATSSGYWGAPLWDSNQIALTSSTTNGMRIPNISYAGTALASSTTYYWRIAFWDNLGNDLQWSTEQASFSIASWYEPSPPTALKTNAQVNPVDLTPPIKFSAQYNDPDVGDTAVDYEVQVSPSSTDWSALMWDSGEVANTAVPVGSRLSNILYSGSPLIPGTTYYWRIRFWDNHGAIGDWSTVTTSFSEALSQTGGTIQDIYYTYDKAGNITKTTDYSNTQAAKTVAFTYDYLNRLTSASTTAASSTPYTRTYTYDKVGNITSASDLGTYSYTGANNANPDAVNTIGTSTLKYDKDGNVKSYGAAAYTWDYRNRLASAFVASATTTFAYDYQNERVERTTGTTSPIVYANDLYNTNGSNATRYLYAPDGTLIATVKGIGSTTTTYTHPDNLGSTNVITDSTGALTGLYDYYPYGSQRLDVGSNQQRQYIGEVYDSATDLSYLNARYMDPARGQFLSQDPQFWTVKQNYQDPQSLNAYSYAEGNPITGKDPSGQSSMFTNLFMQMNWLNGETNGAFGNEVQAELTGYGQAAGTVASYLPITGNLMALGEAISGKDYVSGDSLSGMSRALLFAGAIAGPGDEEAVAAARAAQLFKESNPAGQALMQGVKNSRVLTLIRDNYRFRASGQYIGNGSTADAAKYTAQTGIPVGNSDHVEKLENTLGRIDNIISDLWDKLNESERNAVTHIQSDVKHAYNQVKN